MRFDLQEWYDRLDWWWFCIRRSLVALSYLLADLGWWVLDHALYWWHHRPRRLLLQGLPAVLALAAVLGVAVTIAQADPAARKVDYVNHARNCLETGDYDEALTSYERAVQLDPQNREYIFGVAQAVEARGDIDRATAIVMELAPETDTGYGLAHFWLARRLLQQPQPTRDGQLRIERHLLRALAAEPNLIAAHILLAQLYLTTSQLHLAEPHILKAIPTRPDLRLGLAKVYRSMGRYQLANMNAQLALEYFQERTEAEVDNPIVRLRWSEAAMLLGDYPKAVEILRRGLELFRATAFRQQLAEVYALWSDTYADNSVLQLGRQLALIQQGMAYDPANQDLLFRLRALSKPPQHEVFLVLGTSVLGYGAAPLDSAPLALLYQLSVLARRLTDPGQARAALQSLLVKGEVPAMVHLALGSDAWEQGKTDEARSHWEQAYRQAPQMALVVNNLAWVLAHVEPIDLARALQLSDSLVKSSGGDPVFRSTRGHVLVKFKRWKEALPDLEAGLQAYPDNPQLHRVLGETYKQLGMMDLSQKHMQLAVPRK